MRINRHTLIGILIALILVIGLTGCGRGSEKEAYYDAEPTGGVMRMAAAESMPLEAPQADDNLILEEGRKKIFTADVSLEVEDLEEAEEAITSLIKEYAGWVDRSSFYETSFSMTVRIPSEQLDQFLKVTGTFGKVVSKSISADDVTDYYYDTEARLETLYILKDRYTEYLKSAETMEDILTVERELNSTISEIESYERTMRRLDGQIDYAMVYFYAELPPEEQVTGNVPSFLEGLKRLGWGFVSLLYYIGMGLLYAVIFGIPIILVLGLIYWICWGRIGLVRKFFRLLSRRHHKGHNGKE